MKKAVRRILKRIFILIMIVFAVYLLISNIDLIRKLAGDEKIMVLVDSDAGADDLFSIRLMLEARDIEVVLSEYVRSPVVTVIMQGFQGSSQQQVRVVGQDDDALQRFERDGAAWALEWILLPGRMPCHGRPSTSRRWWR